MGLFFNHDDDDDVEVTYTGSELYRLTDSDGSYDAKIDAKGEGSFNYYETESDWEDHSHKHVNSNGEIDYDRPEGYNHSWEHRQKD